MIDKINKSHKIIVVAGGWSDEREISLLSGKNVYNCLKSNKYNVKFFNLKKNNIQKILQLKPDIIFNKSVKLNYIEADKKILNYINNSVHTNTIRKNLSKVYSNTLSRRPKKLLKP